MAVDAALAQLSTAGTYSVVSFSEEDTVHSVFDSFFQYGLVSVECRVHEDIMMGDETLHKLLHYLPGVYRVRSLRNIISQVLTAQQDYYNLIAGQWLTYKGWNLDDYIKYIKLDGAPADELCLVVVAEILQLEICVILRSRVWFTHNVKNGMKACSIFLAYVGNGIFAQGLSPLDVTPKKSKSAAVCSAHGLDFSEYKRSYMSKDQIVQVSQLVKRLSTPIQQTTVEIDDEPIPCVSEPGIITKSIDEVAVACTLVDMQTLAGGFNTAGGFYQNAESESGLDIDYKYYIKGLIPPGKQKLTVAEREQDAQRTFARVGQRKKNYLDNKYNLTPTTQEQSNSRTDKADAAKEQDKSSELSTPQKQTPKGQGKMSEKHPSKSSAQKRESKPYTPRKKFQTKAPNSKFRKTDDMEIEDEILSTHGNSSGDEDEILSTHGNSSGEEYLPSDIEMDSDEPVSDAAPIPDKEKTPSQPKAAKPATPSKPAKPSKAAKPAKPSKSSKPSKPSKPSVQQDKAAKSATPAKKPKSADSATAHRPTLPRKCRERVIPEKVVGIPKRKPRVISVKCKFCRETFDSYKARTAHYKSYHKMIFLCRPACGKAFQSRASLLKHKFTHQKKIFEHKCDICKKKFPYAYMLREHAGSHLPKKDKLFKCFHGKCPHSFSTKTELTRHVKSHQGIKYLCSEANCAFSDVNEKSVYDHILQTHGPKDQYTCPKCGTQCQRRNKMNRHIKKCCPKSKAIRRIWYDKVPLATVPVDS